jgi:hypothetical protein
MINICRYSAKRKNEWNDFLSSSKNGTFIFHRDYMEYHRDRFQDFSLMIYDDDDLIALLPANIGSDCLISHEGLTFGGFIIDKLMRLPTMLRVFKEVIRLIQQENIKKFIYKKIPYIYSTIPSDEDLYALSRIGARLIRRDVSSTISLKDMPPFQKNRIRSIKKAENLGVNTHESDEFALFWRILNLNLFTKYNKYPVHSIDEIIYLHNKFPRNIRLFASYKDETMLAGIMIYESSNVVHAQYIATDPYNRVPGSIDIIISHLIQEYSSKKNYFDFGISTENCGLYLNEDLVFFKEGFGARSVVYDFYEVDLNEPTKNTY